MTSRDEEQAVRRAQARGVSGAVQLNDVQTTNLDAFGESFNKPCFVDEINAIQAAIVDDFNEAVALLQITLGFLVDIITHKAQYFPRDEQKRPRLQRSTSQV